MGVVFTCWASKHLLDHLLNTIPLEAWTSSVYVIDFNKPIRGSQTISCRSTGQIVNTLRTLFKDLTEEHTVTLMSSLNLRWGGSSRGLVRISQRQKVEKCKLYIDQTETFLYFIINLLSHDLTVDIFREHSKTRSTEIQQICCSKFVIVADGGEMRARTFCSPSNTKPSLQVSVGRAVWGRPTNLRMRTELMHE